MTATVERPQKPTAPPALSARAKSRSELTSADRVIRAFLAVAGVIPTAALVFLAVVMLRQALPAISANGTHFFTSTKFNIGVGASNGGYGTTTVAASYGVLALLFGTLMCSIIALVIAVPVSVAGALLLAEKVPARFQNPLGVFLELLAGIPSVVYGIWGYFTLGPFLSHNIYRWLSDVGIPWLDGRPQATGLLTASIVLAVMIVPIIAATTRELIRSVPTVSKEGAVALGLTSAESVRFVTIPYVRSGVVAASLLGWARALGETIAVLIISGDGAGVPHSIFGNFYTMAAEIAGDLDAALTDPSLMHTLGEIGLVLLVITLITNFAGRLITQRFGGVNLPVGAGL
ncbi:MAG TPA: phosphate ABC transporter permease subunit PstC [Acidimicrobiales bacterium]|jgi:phosphate transport system permease protein|nr:phosphate ABC transporter permease subunit PstC [Acidimicrobiales bacterium]